MMNFFLKVNKIRCAYKRFEIKAIPADIFVFCCFGEVSSLADC